MCVGGGGGGGGLDCYCSILRANESVSLMSPVNLRHFHNKRVMSTNWALNLL